LEDVVKKLKWPEPIPCLDDEIWKVHPIYTDIWASSFGRIWRSCHLASSGTKDNQHFRLKCGNFANLSIKKSPNTNYLVCPRDGKNIGVHRLVCEAFNGLPQKADFVCHHIDGNGLNNNHENLEWLTTVENTTEGLKRKGLYGRGHHQAKLTDSEVREICKLLVLGKSNQDIAKSFSVSRTTIRNIRIKKVWIHLTCVQQLPD
jgi:hypothetical protein